MARLGVIDLGSNSVRLVVYETKREDAAKPFRTLVDEKKMAGLAAYVTDGALSNAGITRAVAVLGDLLKLADNLNCARVDIFATAVLRNCANSEAATAAIEAAIHEVNRDENVHGCLLFRPLPSFVDESHMCELLDPKKDIDGITLASLASVFTDGHAGYPPATAAACIQLLDHYQVPLQGKHVVVVGRSLVVGKPVSMMLLRRNASVTICHSKTENLADIMRSADVVICATGRARTFGAQFFGPGQTVLDVGINFDTQGNLCGDVDFAEVEPVVAAITPVPGGIGTVTTSVTMAHTVAAAEAALAARTGRR